MNIPGYDSWKLATPPEYDELGPEDAEETEEEYHERLAREQDEAEELACAEADRKEEEEGA